MSNLTKSKIFISPNRYDVKTIIQWFNAAYTQRSSNLISLFLCNLSSNCPLKFYVSNQDLSRVDLDLKKGRILIYNLNFNKPDIIIKKSLSIETK